MKRCPQCGASFSDDNSFCLSDGAVLVAEIQMPAGFASGDQATQVVNRTPVAIGSSSPRWPYVLIGVLTASVLGLAGMLLLQPKSGEPPVMHTPSNTTLAVASDTVAPTPAANIVANVSPADSRNLPTISPAGSWRGNWSSPSGAYLKYDLDLNESGGSVSGQINWTLLRTTRPDKQSKIGSSAIEYVSGTFNPETRQVTMRGTSKSDPNNMLVMLDQYRLTLATDGRRLNGSARNGGQWNGRIELVK